MGNKYSEILINFEYTMTAMAHGDYHILIFIHNCITCRLNINFMCSRAHINLFICMHVSLDAFSIFNTIPFTCVVLENSRIVCLVTITIHFISVWFHHLFIYKYNLYFSTFKLNFSFLFAQNCSRIDSIRNLSSWQAFSWANWNRFLCKPLHLIMVFFFSQFFFFCCYYCYYYCCWILCEYFSSVYTVQICMHIKCYWKSIMRSCSGVSLSSIWLCREK